MSTHKIEIDVIIYIYNPRTKQEIEIEKTATIECYRGSRTEECWGIHTIDESSDSLICISDLDGNNIEKEWGMYDVMINSFGNHKDLEDYILDEYADEIEEAICGTAQESDLYF